MSSVPVELTGDPDDVYNHNENSLFRSPGRSPGTLGVATIAHSQCSHCIMSLSDDDGDVVGDTDNMLTNI